MALRVIGAGVGRTGTHSLKIGLERLLGAPCYHMVEVFEHREHIPLWRKASTGQMPDWNALFEGYAAAVDWPASAFCWELAEAYPDAIIVLSTRDPQAWWRSAHETIFPTSGAIATSDPLRGMIEAMMAARFTSALEDEGACLAAYERHNARVRELIPPDRLTEWTAADGWAPLCAALGLPVPEESFPHVNTREEWAARRSAVQERIDCSLR